TRFHVVRLVDGHQSDVKYIARPFFTFHHVNAFERDDCIVVDFCAYESAKLLTQFKLSELRQGRLPTEKAYLTRVIIPLNIPKGAKAGQNLLEGVSFAGHCKAVVHTDGCSIFLVSEMVVDTPFEMPRINYALVNGLPYRFVYGSALPGNDRVSLVKVDVISKAVQTWWAGSATFYAGEPVFVPRTGNSSEDDGKYLLRNENVFIEVI
uniref:Uncharacterized protein n=1 Tax=Plectus sambesii TaxID=2011161 RepID=A0A914X398_9BILA